jgi:hypothetical protein
MIVSAVPFGRAKRRRVEKISAAQNRPASGLTQNENPCVFVRRVRTYLLGAGHDNDPAAVRQDALVISPPGRTYS